VMRAVSWRGIGAATGQMITQTSEAAWSIWVIMTGIGMTCWARTRGHGEDAGILSQLPLTHAQ